MARGSAFLLGGDGNGGPYEWASMVEDPDENTGDTTRQAIGALTHDTGVAVQTYYAALVRGQITASFLPS